MRRIGCHGAVVPAEHKKLPARRYDRLLSRARFLESFNIRCEITVQGPQVRSFAKSLCATVPPGVQTKGGQDTNDNNGNLEQNTLPIVPYPS